MVKALPSLLLVIVLVVVITAVVLVARIWWLSLKQPPAYALIVEKYYVCETHKALQGGIFGKGPTKRFFSENARQWCWRWEWQEITREEFMRLATQWYAVNWDEQGAWWRPVGLP